MGSSGEYLFGSMNILYIITHGNQGGAQTHLSKLAIHAKNNGHNVTVAFGNGFWLDNEMSHNQIKTIKFSALERSLNPFKMLLFVKQLHNFLTKNSFDIVHIHSSNAMSAFLARINLKSKCKYVATIHGWSILHPGWKKSRIIKIIYAWLMKIFLIFADKIICVCHADKQLAVQKKICNSSKIHVIHNGAPEIIFFEKNDAREKLKISKSDFVVGIIARFEYAKNIELFIRTAKALSYSSVKFVLIGHGPEEEKLDKMIQENKLENMHVIKELKDASKYLKALDAFMLTSRYEGMPYVLLEAVSAEIPIVSTDVGGIPELIQDNKTGILVSSHDADLFANAIRKLETNNKLRQSLVLSASRLLAEKFSEHKLLNETLNLYNEIYEHTAQ